MAKQQVKHISIRPSEAEEGSLGFPVGSTVTLIEAAWSRWEEAGENALKGGRAADDPALKLVGEVDGSDAEPITVFLGAGKASRMQPSDDGEYLDPVEESTAGALNASCNANIFLDSLCDKKKQGKLALPEEALDAGITKALVGLKFVVGNKVVDRNFADQGDDKAAGGGNKKRPSMIADEIVELPKGGKKSTSSKTSKVSKKDEDADEDAGDGDDASEAAEKAVLDALALPKYRKGLPLDKVYAAVFNLVKEEDNAKEIGKQVEDEDWVKDEARPWNFDEDDEILTEAK